jgi:tRNA A58 N-methylase Trm61
MSARNNFKKAAENVLKGIKLCLPTAFAHAVAERAYDALVLDIPLPEEWGGPAPEAS